MTRRIWLDGCFAKIDRAGKHLETLDAEIRSFLNNASTYGVVAEGDPKTGWRELKFQIYAPPPLLLGVIVGDAIHNMRSALDHLVYELAGRRRGGTQFPIFTNSRDYLEPRENGTSARDFMLKGVSDHNRTIIDQYQPYQRASNSERDLLAVLNSLSNADKHRVVNATFAGLTREPTFDLSPTDPGAAWTGAEIQMLVEPGRALEDNTPLCRFRTSPDPAVEVKVDGQLPLGIGFGKTPAKIATTGTLQRMRKYVAEIIERFG